MTTYKKNYIGKGKQVEGLDIVKVFIPVENIDETIIEVKGDKFLAFEIAKMKEADKFGRTHTVYFQSKEETEPVKPKKKGKKQKSDDDLPF